jgi:hypothetical protein
VVISLLSLPPNGNVPAAFAEAKATCVDQLTPTKPWRRRAEVFDGTLILGE